MKPETLPTYSNPERSPAKNVPSIEKAPVYDGSEVNVERGHNPYEQKSEAGATTSDVNLTTVLPAPVIIPIANDDNTAMSGNPLVANDDDLIEREWVDKAKKIVAETKDDPHKRDHEVNKLQVDYIKKRFGRELGITE